MSLKLQIIILFFSGICIIAEGQSAKTAGEPCTDAMVQNASGRWMKLYDYSPSVTKTQKQESYTRLDVLHNLLLKMYPRPVGVDVRESRGSGPGYFGATRKYRYTPDHRLTHDYLKILPIVTFSYYANFSPHFCVHTDKGIIFERGEKNENGDGIGLNVNDFAGLMHGPFDDWTINGLPVRMLITIVNKKWNGYEVYGDVRSSGRHILIHRKGILPYIPVTRKQYLDRCIASKTQMFDKMIEAAKQTPVRSLEVQEAEKKAKLAKFEKDFGKDPKRLKSAVDYYLSGYKTDQQIRDEQVARVEMHKKMELKYFAEELENTTKQGLLDSPAVILAMNYSAPYVFETDPTKGYMLVTENPDYIRKDLPGYVPQFMVLSWKWSDYNPHKRYEKMFLQDFPIERIQAMIDK